MSVRIRQSPVLTDSDSLYFLIKRCLYQSKSIKKTNFSATSTRNMPDKSICKVWNLKKIGISGDNILWCPTDHMLLLWFLCSRCGSVMKKKKTKKHVISLALLEPMPWNHENAIFWHFLIEIYTGAQKITWHKVNILKNHH